MKRARKGSWVKMGPDPHFATCERCGGTVPPPILPCTFEGVIAYNKYVIELHSLCEEPVVGVSK